MTQLRKTRVCKAGRQPGCLHPPSLAFSPPCQRRWDPGPMLAPYCVYPFPFAEKRCPAHRACGQHVNVWAGGGRRCRASRWSGEREAGGCGPPLPCRWAEMLRLLQRVWGLNEFTHCQLACTPAIVVLGRVAVYAHQSRYEEKIIFLNS